MAEDALSILVIEDDEGIRDTLRRAFERDGHRVETAAAQSDALMLATTASFDMMLLDVDLGPGLDGFQVCRALRSQANTVPIIMLTGLRSEADAVKGLEAGADDYVTKPFGLAELNSRIRAVLRRVGRRETERTVYVAGGLRLDLGRHEVTLAGEPVHLTFSEFQLIVMLMRSHGAVVGRAELMQAIWGDAAYRDLRGIDVHVRHLREKLGTDAIVTVRGEGYRLGDVPPSS